MPLNSTKQETNNRTITISRARRILGAKYSHLSDDQIRELVTTLHLLAKDILGYNGSKKARTHEQWSN